MKTGKQRTSLEIVHALWTRALGLRDQSCSWPAHTSFSSPPHHQLLPNPCHFWAPNSGSSDFLGDEYGFLASEWFSLKFYLSKSQIPIFGKDNEQQVQSLNPNSVTQNGPWAWSSSLPRAEAPTRPGQGFSPCVGLLFLVSGTASTLLFLLKVCAAYGSCPTPLFYLSSEGGDTAASTAPWAGYE